MPSKWIPLFLTGNPLGSVYVTFMPPAVAPVLRKLSVGTLKRTENTSGVVIEIGVPLVAPDGSSGMQYLYVSAAG